MREPEPVTEALLRGWPLPRAAGDKHSRGEVVVVGGAPRSPGAAMLAGRAALRVGAGRLTLAVGASVAPGIAVALPECGVVPLTETRDGHVRGGAIGRAAADLHGADAVLIGPGLDDAGETARMLRNAGRIVPRDAVLVLDAFALGALAAHPRIAGGSARILTPNLEEASLLLGRRPSSLHTDTLELARRYGAVVTCFGSIASPDGRVLTVGTGTPGLGTSGSGDALAGAIAGLAARGAGPLQAAVWGTYLHTSAGAALDSECGFGYLASQIVDRLTHELAALGEATT